MLEFWLIFLLALFTGNVTMGQLSAISSDTLDPFVNVYMEWPCGEELCYLTIDEDLHVETGP